MLPTQISCGASGKFARTSSSVFPDQQSSYAFCAQLTENWNTKYTIHPKGVSHVSRDRGRATRTRLQRKW